MKLHLKKKISLGRGLDYEVGIVSLRSEWDRQEAWRILCICGSSLSLGGHHALVFYVQRVQLLLLETSNTCSGDSFTNLIMQNI